MYQYIKIVWCGSDDVTHEGYQEILSGFVQRNTDLDGNTVNFDTLGECTSWVVDANPPFPVWGT